MTRARATRMKKNYDFSKAVKNPYVKRIIVSVMIENVGDVSRTVRCDALGDTPHGPTPQAPQRKDE